VVLVAGPPEEVETVKKIFDLCTIHRKTTRQIANELNQGQLKNHLGKEWDPSEVRRLIMNPKYMGTYVWARKSRKLQASLTSNDPWTAKTSRRCGGGLAGFRVIKLYVRHCVAAQFREEGLTPFRLDFVFPFR
jgi:hypothetical protein